MQRFFGRLADRFDRVNLMIIGNVLGSLLLFALPFCENFSHFLAVSVFGIFSAMGIPAGTAINAGIGKRYGSMGPAFGLFNMSFSLGMVLGPLTGGAIIDVWGGLDTAFFVGGGIGLLGCIVFILLALRAQRAGFSWKTAAEKGEDVPVVVAEGGFAKAPAESGCLRPSAPCDWKVCLESQEKAAEGKSNEEARSSV